MVMQGRRPGDRRVRVTIARTSSEELEPIRPWRRRTAPGLLLIYGFLALIAIGTVLLSLPIATQDRSWTSPLDALFTATSAVCVTGLVVVVTSEHWSAFRADRDAAPVQAGGFGIMAGFHAPAAPVRARRQVGLSDRSRSSNHGELRLGGVLGVVRNVALFSLWWRRSARSCSRWGSSRRARRTTWCRGRVGLVPFVSRSTTAASISSDPTASPPCGPTAGPGPLGVLILLGSVGFAVVADVAGRRRWRRLTVESRLVLLTTGAVVAAGSLAIMGLEWDSPGTLGALPVEQRPFGALFEAISLRTAGFTTMPVGALAQATLFVVMATMFIGGASGSTAGGIKVTTFAVLAAAILSTARGDSSPSAFGRRFSTELVYRAMSVALLSIAFLFVTALLLNVFSPAPFVTVLFDAISALATAGGSTGVTESADVLGRIVLIVAMFAGRLGPLTLALVLAARSRPAPYRHALETIRIG